MTSQIIYNHIPYFYIIQHKPSGKFYVGCKYSKRKNKTHPDLLLKENGYKTSSKIVRALIEQDGLESFIICDIITEDEVKMPFGFTDILHFETWYLTTYRIAQNKDYINRCNNAPKSPQLFGQNVYVTPDGNKRMSVILAESLGYTTPRKGQKNSQESNLNISKSMIGKYGGQKNPMYGKKREDLAAYNRDPINAARKGREYQELITSRFLTDLNMQSAEFIFAIRTTKDQNLNLGFKQFVKSLKINYPIFGQFLPGRIMTQMRKLTPDLV